MIPIRALRDCPVAFLCVYTLLYHCALLFILSSETCLEGENAALYCLFTALRGAGAPRTSGRLFMVSTI